MDVSPDSNLSLPADELGVELNRQKTGLFQKQNALVDSHTPGKAWIPPADFQTSSSNKKHTNLCAPLSVEERWGKALMEMLHFFSSQQMLNEQQGSLHLHL